MTERRLEAVFPLFFGLYAGASIMLVLLGLLSAVAAAGPAHDALHAAHGAGGAVDTLALGVERASHSHVADDRLQIVLDYLLSAVNIGFGLFLAARCPHWVARLLAVGMVGTATAFNFHSHAFLLVPETAVDNLPVRVHLAIHAISGLAYLHGVLLFPDGRLVPRRVRPVLIGLYGYAVVEVAAAFVVGYAITPYAFGTVAGLFAWVASISPTMDMGEMMAAMAASPEAMRTGIDLTFQAELLYLIAFSGILMPVVGAAAQWYRYRLASHAERQQIKLLLWALSVAAVVGVGALAVTVGPAGELVPEARLEKLDLALHALPPLFTVIPVALFVAVVRHHLFDVDLLIRRTLVYGTLVASLLVVYWGSVVLLQRLFRAVAGEQSDVAIVISTLGIAALLNPLRSRLQAFVDRRFYRSRYDSARTLAAFGAKVRDEVDLERLTDQLAGVVGETMEVGHVSVWLRSAGNRP